MNRKQIIALWLYNRRRKRRQRKRHVWVHPINERREKVGLLYTLFEDLRRDENKFFNYFRMSIASFDELYEKLKDALQRQNTQFLTSEVYHGKWQKYKLKLINCS